MNAAIDSAVEQATQTGQLTLSLSDGMTPAQMQETVQRCVQVWKQQHPENSGDLAITTSSKDGGDALVKGINDDGSIEEIEPIAQAAPKLKQEDNGQENQQKLPWYLDFDNRKSPLDNFLEKFAKAYHEGIDRITIGPAEKVHERIKLAQSESQQSPDDPEQSWALQQERIDETKIDWEQLKAIGITKETLREIGAYEQFLRGEHTPSMPLTIQPPAESGIKHPIEFHARIRIEQTLYGMAINLLPHRAELDLHQKALQNLTPEQRAELLKQGIVTGKNQEGKDTQFLVDRETNQIVEVQLHDAKALIERQVWASKLTEEQIQSLSEGKWVRVEGMPSPDPKGRKDSLTGQIRVDMQRKTLQFAAVSPEKLRHHQKGKQAEGQQRKQNENRAKTQREEKKRQNHIKR